MRPPSGTVTFLLTDVEGSTQAWQRDETAAKRALARQEEIISAAVSRHEGFRPVEQGEGDSVVAAFARATNAVAAAVEAQLALAEEPGLAEHPLRVRMALHTGEADVRDGRYAGPTIIRAARLRGAAHGGQTVVSRATAELVSDTMPEGAALVDLGTHRLRDLARAERVYQIVHPDLEREFPPLRSLDRVANNLPAQLTSFVGRASELAQIERLLAQVQLLTLTGAGGCGKTRLAAHAAALVADSYSAGVWWVDLATLGTGSGVSTAVLSALGLREHASRTALDQLCDHLGDDRALLVIDNCEHVLDHVAELVEPLLRRKPQLTVLATSREALGVPGEATWGVPPLAAPAAPYDTSRELLGTYDSVALFVERARQARPNFALTDDNAPVLAEICARLDGLPLAIELAAARVRVLSPDGIRRGLDDRFRLLAGGSKRVPARHQTLAASVEWSHDLLDETDRTLLRRLSVFVGGFTLDAAERVCAGEAIESLQILDGLTSLVDKSLVVADDAAGTNRYRLLETIRQFGATKLSEAGEATAVRDAHLAVQLDLAAQGEVNLLSNDDLVTTLEAEHDNLRAALAWALSSSRVDDAIQLTVGLSHLWLSRGLFREACTWFDRLLDDPGVTGSPVRYRAVWARAILGLFAGQPYGGPETHEEVVETARRGGDRRYVARGLMVLGTTQAMVSPAAGGTTLHEAVTLADEVGDPISSVFARLLLAVTGLHRDDHDFVASQFHEGGGSLEQASGQLRSMYHALAAWREVRLGLFDEARDHLRAADALAAGVADYAFAGALAALTSALLELSQGRIGEAAAVLEVALEESRAVGGTREDAMLTGAWGLVLAARGRFDEAEMAMADGVRLAEQIGDGLQYLFCQAWYGGLMRLRGERQRSRSAVEAMHASARQQENTAFEALALRELSHHERLDANLEAADDLAHRALALAAGTGLQPDMADHLDAVAGIAAAGESWVEAARLFAAASALRNRLGSVAQPWDQRVHTADLATTRHSLDPDAFEEAWAEGEALSLDAAVAYARRGRGERKRPSAGWLSLTPTERQVVELLGEGLRNNEIAERLFVAPSTVKTHLSHVFSKLGVTNRAELAVLAARKR